MGDLLKSLGVCVLGPPKSAFRKYPSQSTFTTVYAKHNEISRETMFQTCLLQLWEFENHHRQFQGSDLWFQQSRSSDPDRVKVESINSRGSNDIFVQKSQHD